MFIIDHPRLFQSAFSARAESRTEESTSSMARRINKLSARSAETLKKPGRYSDGGNLYLSISDNGGRRWVFLYRRAGKQREMGLGSASRAGISLARARTLAAEA